MNRSHQEQKSETQAKPPVQSGEGGKKFKPCDRMIQDRPLHIEVGNENSFDIMVDRVFSVENYLVLAGWSSSPCTFGIICNGIQYSVDMESVSRPDVNTYLGVESSFELGFSLCACCEELGQHSIALQVESLQHGIVGTFPLRKDPFPDDMKEASAAFGSIFTTLLRQIPPHSKLWEKLVDIVPTQHAENIMFEGVIEHSIYSAYTDQLYVFGWLACHQDLPLWICDEAGKKYHPETVYRFPRDDVRRHLGDKYRTNQNYGFILVIENGPRAGFIICKTFQDNTVYAFARTAINNIGYDVQAYANAILSLPLTSYDFCTHVDTLFAPLLSQILFLKKQYIKELPIEVTHVGEQPLHPKLSIIIPLYGRYDFVDVQLVDCLHDNWIQENCELIYVVDDLNLYKPFIGHMEELYRILGISLVCVWGGMNRGFSGANNLGASVARAETLLFMNSDVFMNSPSGISRLYEMLHSNEQIGAVGARLLRADGSIQHAGMSFRRRNELSIWVTEHPYAGCSPDLDPAQSPAEVPAVTGACLMMKTENYNAVGGWSEDYFIGDFEDSDLCFKLHQAALKIVYCPQVSFTHLERQSIQKIDSSPDLRQKITLYNAVIHQHKWEKSLEAFQRLHHLQEQRGSI